jgi:hypothetical protein
MCLTERTRDHFQTRNADVSVRVALIGVPVVVAPHNLSKCNAEETEQLAPANHQVEFEGTLGPAYFTSNAKSAEFHPVVTEEVGHVEIKLDNK